MPRAKARSVTRARTTREMQDARVTEVVRLMAGGEWHTGPSHVAMAKKLGATIDVVEKVASTASKVVRALATIDADEMRARMMFALEDNRRRALEKTRTYITKDGDTTTVDDPDIKAANQSIAVQAQLFGLATTNVVAKVSVERERFEKLSAQEKLDEALRVRAELDAEIAKLRAETAGRTA